MKNDAMQRQEKKVENKYKFNNDSRISKSEKIFDKKKYRMKKYSNKYKVDKWQLRTTLAILRDFYKQYHKDEYGQQNKSEFKTETSEPKKSLSFFDIARSEYLQKKADKKRKKEEMLRIKTEKEEALRKYKEKKMQKYKKLSKKTKKGQPVMKERIELLLQKIQQDKNNGITM
ncbi:PREDICTED: thyroid transcription factor 1-associated protein 26 homolog [Polistes canadensis]|uniref:thyroid transcription factor 1-associated protein 26 homolog n=1 Tax=Polistes canadensis TaxID=91411 RepID=UPI000718E16E|nr:PREDICTED: thyroid transcription factor 1-associated protein 26 homolog [Polistes canadensis]